MSLIELGYAAIGLCIGLCLYRVITLYLQWRENKH